MKHITTYYAGRKNIAVRLAALLMLVSAVARIVCQVNADRAGVMVVVVRILLPVAANLLLACQLLFMTEKRFYVTRVPFALFALVFIDRVAHLGVSKAMTAICILFCILQAVLYCATCRGHFKTMLWALLSWTVPLAVFCLDGRFRSLLAQLAVNDTAILVADVSIVLGVILTMLAAKAMPPYREGDPYRMRPGDRPDGRMLRTRNPMDRVAGFIMPIRNGADNHITFSVECSNLEKYVHQKRREGLKHFGLTHAIIATYARCVAELPGLNRFFVGQTVYNHGDTIIVNMMVKKSMELNAEEECIKVNLSPRDTAEEVYRKYDETLKKTITGEDEGFDNLVRVLNYIPRLLFRLVFRLLSFLDYFGLLPGFLTDLSPFHGSMFITSMGSLGIPPITHHLYDFGTVPVFCAFGAKRTERELDSEGKMVVKKYLDMKWNTDERVCDGHYYASVFKRVRYYLTHPEKLDEPPEVVNKDID